MPRNPKYDYAVHVIEQVPTSKQVKGTISAMTMGSAARKVRRKYKGKLDREYSVAIAANPEMYCLINTHGKVIRKSRDYDALTDAADRHNERASKREYYVVSEADVKAKLNEHMRELGRTEKRNCKCRKFRTKQKNGENNRKFEVAKRNSVASDFKTTQRQKLLANAKTFQGKLTGEKRRVMMPNLAPKGQYRLGHLKQLIIKRPNGAKWNINFDGDSFLGGDVKNNLWIDGADARISNIKANHLPKGGHLHHLGKLMQIDYQTAKAHIGGNKSIYFWHKTGEVTRENPELYVDSDGFPIIVGGNYDVWKEGIVN